MINIALIAALFISVYVGVQDCKNGRPFVGGFYLGVSGVLAWALIVGVTPIVPPL